ncbi:hypothetical protein Hanom_Chr14g01275091 [Helianthus anomalus]
MCFGFVTEDLVGGNGRVKKDEDLVCLYPFTSASSATQGRIKQQYDQLVKSHESKGLALLQLDFFTSSYCGIFQHAL